MWKLSEPGADAEALFMRLPQTEYYRHIRASPDALELMPGVRIRHIPRPDRPMLRRTSDNSFEISDQKNSYQEHKAD
jgi:hypothetical protein